MDRFDAQALAHYLMVKHYPLMLHTRAPNLLRLTRHVNGVQTQTFNRRNRLVGYPYLDRRSHPLHLPINLPAFPRPIALKSASENPYASSPFTLSAPVRYG